MKKFAKFAIIALFATMMGMVACNNPVPDGPVNPGGDTTAVASPLKDASIKAKLTSTSIEEATIQVNFNVVNELAYMVVEADITNEEVATRVAKSTPTAEEVFANGTPIEITKDQAVVRLTVKDLKPDTGYIIYVAGRLVEEEKTYVYDKVESVSLLTYAQPVLTAKVTSVGTTAVKFQITSNRISRYAYLVYRVKEAPEEIPSADIIFATGKMGSVESAQTDVVINALMPNNDYVIYIAGEVEELEEYFDEIVTLDGIKTQDFGEAYQIHSVDYASFKVDLKLPDSIAELNHILKYGMWDLYAFNLNHKFGKNGRPESWAQSINLHEDYYSNQITESQTLTFSNNTAWVTDEYGNPLYDDEYESYRQVHSLLVPGQPNMLMIGEYRYGDHEVYANFTDGYYQPLFLSNEYFNAWAEDVEVSQNQVPWWYGFAIQELVTNKQPEPFSGTVNIEVLLSEDNNNTKAKLRFTPSEEVEQYCVWVITESMRQEVLPFLNNDEKYMQWFITSESGFNEGALSMTGAKEMWMGQDPDKQGNCFYFVDGALTNTKNVFHAYAVAMGGGDKDGDGICDATLQTMVHKEFKLGEPRLPEPKVEITVMESDPDMVRFNIKNATEKGVPIAQAYYIANYEREWLGAGYSPETLLDYYGTPMSKSELAMINSPEGYTIEFQSRPNATTYFAMKVYNGESYFTYSGTYKATSSVTSGDNKVESEYFTSLNGDWTAKATILYKKTLDEDTGEIGTVTEEKTSKVSIGQQTYPETLPQSVYDTFAQHNVSKEATDKYFAELTDAIDNFNDDARNRNQIICTGWSFDLTGEAKDGYQSAYDLFISNTYNGWSSTSPVYDFGPKWYIQFDAEGNAWVPFNINNYIPMSSWTTTDSGYGEYINEYHLLAYNATSGYMYPYIWDEEANILDGKFPVEISADGNTITIKPMVLDGVNYYPNMGAVQDQYYTQFAVASSVISEIVLTRGWSGESQKAKAKMIGGQKQVVDNSHKVSPVRRTNSRTNFTTPVTMHEEVEPFIIRDVNEYLETARKRVESGFYNR